MTDEEIDTSDIPLLDDDFFANAKLRMPEGKVSLLVNIDEDIVDWYKEKGIDMSQFLNSALRDYADAHRQ